MLLTDTKFIILLFIGNMWIHPQLGIGRGKATSWTTEAGPQAPWVLPPTFCDATPHLRSCSSRGWIGHRWEDVECHFPGKTGGEISGVDPVLPVCPVLPLHPTPEEYARQAGARQAKSHDPFHRYPSCGDVGGRWASPLWTRGEGSRIAVRMLKLRVTVLEGESSKWQSRCGSQHVSSSWAGWASKSKFSGWAGLLRKSQDLDGGQRQEGPQVQNTQGAQYTFRPTRFWDADHVPFNT